MLATNLAVDLSIACDETRMVEALVSINLLFDSTISISYTRHDYRRHRPSAS